MSSLQSISIASFLLTWEGGVSLPVPGADGLAVVTRRRSGVVLGRTGASSDRELRRAGVGLELRAAFLELCLQVLKDEPEWGSPEGVPVGRQGVVAM